MYKILINLNKIAFSFIFCLLAPKLNAYQYKLSVSAMFKDEAPYLKEWIEYHKLMGVEQFRLYNNDSSDNFRTVLAPYILKGEVTVIDWPSSKSDLVDWTYYSQWPAYVDSIKFFTGKSKWLAMIDVDEFLHPLNDPDMITFLNDYEDYEGVVLNWQCFGTSNIKEIPTGKLQIETLNWKAKDLSQRNFPVKSIVKPHCVDVHRIAWQPHTCHYLSGSPAVFADKKFRKETQFAHHNRIVTKKAVINHYVHRTENYFWNVKIAKKRRMENGASGYTDKYIKEWRNECNKVEDKRIHRFVPLLREKMSE